MQNKNCFNFGSRQEKSLSNLPQRHYEAQMPKIDALNFVAVLCNYKNFEAIDTWTINIGTLNPWCTTFLQNVLGLEH